MEKYITKFKTIYITYFYILILHIFFFQKYIKCYNRKIELKSSYINLKTKGTGEINIFSNSLYKSDYPTTIIINDVIIKTNSEITNIIEIDLSNFDTSMVTTMERMFYWCYELISVNLSNLNTSSVTSMETMFYCCKSLISLDLSSFNTSIVTSMSFMFYWCKSLISLDLSNFDTSCVTTMENMFYESTTLVSLDLSNFNLLKVTNMDCIFKGCNKLEIVNLRQASINSNITFSEACSNNPTKLTYKREH